MKYILKYPLFENKELAYKYYFSKNFLSKEQEKIILSITNNDNYTKALCDICYKISEDDSITLDTHIKNVLQDVYEQLKTYKKTILPIKNLNINDLTNQNPLIFEVRKKSLDILNTLPSIAIRNLKKEISKVRDYSGFLDYLNDLDYFRNLYKYISNRSQEETAKIRQKMFKNDITIKDLIKFCEDKYNLIGGIEYTKEDILDIINSNYELDLVYDENNVIVIEVSGPTGIRAIGKNSLWCFTYGSNTQEDWIRSNYHGYVYVIINLNEKQDSPDFMYVLLKPLDIHHPDGRVEFEIDDILYDMSNDPVYDADKVIDKLIGLDRAKDIFTF